jgi:hypothetical protein
VQSFQFFFGQQHLIAPEFASCHFDLREKYYSHLSHGRGCRKCYMLGGRTGARLWVVPEIARSYPESPPHRLHSVKSTTSSTLSWAAFGLIPKSTMSFMIDRTPGTVGQMLRGNSSTSST